MPGIHLKRAGDSIDFMPGRLDVLLFEHEEPAQCDKVLVGPGGGGAIAGYSFQNLYLLSNRSVEAPVRSEIIVTNRGL